MVQKSHTKRLPWGLSDFAPASGEVQCEISLQLAFGLVSGRGSALGDLWHSATGTERLSRRVDVFVLPEVLSGMGLMSVK